MNILMFGRGVISAQYGWALEKAGHKVEFYVRPGRAQTYGNSVSLDILDMRRGFRGQAVKTAWPVTMRETLPDDHDYDLIVVSVQHYQFREVAKFLASRLSNATVLIFNNFWNEPLEEASALPLDRLVWGFPAAGGGFGADGTLRGAFFRKVDFGTFGAELTGRDRAVRNLFTESGFRVVEHQDFRSWLLVHFVTNAGLLSESPKVGSTMQSVRSARRWEDVVLNTRELFPILEARGVQVSKHPSLKIFTLPAYLSGLAMRLTLNLYPPMRRVLQGHSNPEEVKSYSRDMLSEARKRGIRVPRLEASEPYFS